MSIMATTCKVVIVLVLQMDLSGHALQIFLAYSSSTSSTIFNRVMVLIDYNDLVFGNFLVDNVRIVVEVLAAASALTTVFFTLNVTFR